MVTVEKGERVERDCPNDKKGFHDWVHVESRRDALTHEMVNLKECDSCGKEIALKS
jgi:hypothetical protein